MSMYVHGYGSSDTRLYSDLVLFVMSTSRDDVDEGMRLPDSICVGDVLCNTKVIHHDDTYYFLARCHLGESEPSFYDILLPKEDFVKEKGHPKNTLDRGDMLDVEVVDLAIAEDGTPGAFVRCIRIHLQT